MPVYCAVFNFHSLSLKLLKLLVANSSGAFLIWLNLINFILTWFCLAYIRLTVFDSDGLTDSSTATVRVSIPKDAPPQARAGTDRVITLPLNHLTLWGNHSMDDHAITSYLWTLHPSSRTQKVIMQVIRSLVYLVHKCIVLNHYLGHFFEFLIYG